MLFLKWLVQSIGNPFRTLMPGLLRVSTLAGVCWAGTAGAAPFFAQFAPIQGVTFQVESVNDSSINKLTIRAATAAGVFSTIEAEADGTITGADVGDLDANGYPEIYVFVTSAGSGSYGSLVAYASNRNKSLSPITMASPPQDSRYQGHDRFAVGEGALIRNHPLYGPGDPNSKPGIPARRQIQYKLKAGEAGWLLVIDKAFDIPTNTLRTK